ncbi:hypothetical protein BOX15_Mlig003464g1, partial [Macrostomum lignano]
AFPGANQSGELALTDLDRELLRQCQQESFYRRCLPFSAALTLVTFWRHRLGHYQKFIALRYLGSIVAGNILGRVSYLGVCRRKFMDTDEEQSAVKTMLMKKQPLQQQQQKQQQHPQQQQWPKRDISLDNQRSIQDLSDLPLAPPPSQQQQQPKKDPIYVKPDYSYGSFSEQYQKPFSSSYYEDDRSGLKSSDSDQQQQPQQARSGMLDDEFFNKARQD